MVIPTTQDIARIAAIGDPVERNRQITLCYHDLAQVLAERTGGKANWCSFATWASRQAGQTIRKEDLAHTLQAELGLSSRQAAEQALQNLVKTAGQLGASLGARGLLTLFWKVYDPQAAFERSSAAVAAGNLKVFAEIAHHFARFYAEILPAGAADPERIARFADELRPGEPPDGQGRLRSAFLHYYQALSETDDQAQTELLLLANLEIGLHEQTRLQPQIVEALAAPVAPPEALAANLLNLLKPGLGWWAAAGLLVLRLTGRLKPFERAVEALLDVVRLDVQWIVTRTMMTLDLPGRPRLRLGEDLPAPIPPALRQLHNPDLLALLAQIDPTPNSTAQSGAALWGNLPERIHFIADLFRCFALSPELHAPLPPAEN